MGKDVPIFASPLLQKGVDLEIVRTTASCWSIFEDILICLTRKTGNRSKKRADGH